MPDSNGEESEKSPRSQGEGKKSEQTKRKRNRNRKRNKKVENLVSKTFQAKLVANSPAENTAENQKLVPLKSQTELVDQDTITEAVQEDFSKKNQSKLPSENNTPNRYTCENQQPTLSLRMPESTPIKRNVCPEPKVTKLNDSKMLKPHVGGDTATEKSREEILAEREAKKLAKQQAKKKNKVDSQPTENNLAVKTISESSLENKANKPDVLPHAAEPSIQKPKKLNDRQEQRIKLDTSPATEITTEITTSIVTEKLVTLVVSDNSKEQVEKIKDKKPILTKAERRAIQEAQRSAKAELSANKLTKKPVPAPVCENKTSVQHKEDVTKRAEKLTPVKSTKDCKVKLFNHLESCNKDSNLFVNNPHIHPIVVRLGEQYAKRTIVGSNARCISFLNALKTVIQDYETPAKKEFARSLETTIKDSVDHLHKCRPLAVSVCNAYKHIKHVLTQLPVDQPESELKEYLCHFVDTYIENQIGKAAQAISSSVQDKISNGDVILTFGCSSLINYIFEEAHRRHVDFRVIVVDSRPFLEGQELLRRLSAKEIPCTYVLINAVGFVMPEVTKILLGAHALLSNGYVMARAGTAQVALVARSFNVPVLVCCETHKFSERFQTDAIVYNELGNPDDLVISDKCRLMNWQSQNKLSPLNLNYDITPPELVTAVVTEVAILPCTSVPVILRIKPTEIGY